MLVAHHLSSNRLGSFQELFQHVNASLYPKDLKRRKQSVNTCRFPWNIITKQVRKKQRLYIHVNHYHTFTVKFSFDRRRSSGISSWQVSTFFIRCFWDVCPSFQCFHPMAKELDFTWLFFNGVGLFFDDFILSLYHLKHFSILSSIWVLHWALSVSEKATAVVKRHRITQTVYSWSMFYHIYNRCQIYT